MTSLVIGQWDGINGSVTTADDEGAGSSSIDIAVGAFTGTSGLPTSIASEGDWFNFANQLEAKTTQAFDDGVNVQMSSARFAGVGGAGADIFDITNSASATLSGHAGNDTLTSGSPNDNLYGEAGDDILNGGSGDDYSDGGSGDDIVAGGLGDDTLQGGVDNDTVHVVDGPAPYTTVTVDLELAFLETDFMTFGTTLSGFENVQGSSFHDWIGGEEGANVLAGAAGDDTLSGLDGADRLIGGAGDDIMDGGAGTDTASYEGASAGVTVSLAQTGQQNTQGAGKDTLSGFENLTGSSHGDTLRGDGLDNLLEGGGGADTLTGGLGDDTLDGGAGADTVDYRAVLGSGVTVSLATLTPQLVAAGMNHKLESISHLIGSRNDDSLTGNSGANRLDGGRGNDALAGDVGADTLVGGANKDLLTGGANADLLSGGLGKDRFVYNSIADTFAAQADRITDLEAQDRILLTNIDAKTDKAGNQAFELVAAFTGKSGEAVLVYDAGDDETELQLDVDGDGTADGVILIDGDQTGFANFAL